MRAQHFVKISRFCRQKPRCFYSGWENQPTKICPTLTAHKRFHRMSPIKSPDLNYHV